MKWLLIAFAMILVLGQGWGCSGRAGKQELEKDVGEGETEEIGIADGGGGLDLEGETVPDVVLPDAVLPDPDLPDVLEDSPAELSEDVEPELPEDVVPELMTDVEPELAKEIFEDVEQEITTQCCVSDDECQEGFRCEESISACVPKPFEGQCWHDGDCVGVATCVGSYLCECAGADNYSCGDCLAECEGPDKMGVCTDITGTGLLHDCCGLRLAGR